MANQVLAHPIYDEHKDVVWDEVEVNKPRPDVFAVQELARQREPVPSRSLHGAMVQRDFGVCLCWICSDTQVPPRENQWLLLTLAKYALNLPQPEQALWIADWTMRHGKFAGAVLNRHINWVNAMNGFCST